MPHQCTIVFELMVIIPRSPRCRCFAFCFCSSQSLCLLRSWGIVDTAHKNALIAISQLHFSCNSLELWLAFCMPHIFYHDCDIMMRDHHLVCGLCRGWNSRKWNKIKILQVVEKNQEIL